MVIATCALYGATTYTNSWLGINVLVILISFLVVAVVYAISSIMPVITRQRMISAARAEITQAMISVVILIILLGVAVTACNISATLSKSLIPSANNGMDPFQYADYYIGNLSLNTGINLLTTIYSTSVQYAIEAQVLQSVGAFFNTQFSSVTGILRGIFTNAVQGSFAVGIASVVQLATVFSTLGQAYLGLSSLVTLAIGLLFIQFLMLPVLQYTAFSIVLPVALAMRSLSFMGNSLKRASNSVLAFAIAAYIIYPLTIAFNGYAISWIYSAQNPSFQYLHSTYLVSNVVANPFFKVAPSAGGTQGGLPGLVISAFGNAPGSITNLMLSSFSKTGFIILPWTIAAQAQLMVTQIAQFLFAAVVLMIIDLAITIGFASGLAKALNGGVEGAGSFWSGV